MKKNHLLILVGLAVVIGLAGIYFQNSQSAGWRASTTDRTILQNLPVNDITAIQIRSAPATVTLEKKGNEWGVAERNDYPADFTKIRDLVKMLWGLKAGQEMQVGASQLGRLNLITPGQGTGSGVEIDLKGDKENQIASLIIGKSMDRGSATVDSTTTTGRFVYNPALKDRVYLVSEPFSSIDPVSVGSWLDKTFVAPGEVKAIDQSGWSNNPGWKVVRKDPKAEWQLEDRAGENLEKSFAQSLSTFGPTFVDVRPSSISADESGFKDPFKISVKTFDGFTYDLVVGKEGPDKARYVQIRVSADLPSGRTPGPNESAEDKKKNDEEFNKKTASLKERLEKEQRFQEWVYLVPDWNLEQLLKRRDEIVAKATPSPSPAGSPTPEPASSPLATPSSVQLPEATPTPAASKTPESTPSVSPTSGETPAPTPALRPTP